MEQEAPDTESATAPVPPEIIEKYLQMRGK
jgi:hypothetical protein